jgi:hypothetical protein
MKPDASSTGFSSWIGKANRQNQMKLRGTMPSWKDQRLSFARAHIAQLVYDRVEFEDAIAILYRIVGQSLLKYRPLSYYERQNQLATPKRALDTPSDLRRPHIAAAAADTTSTVLKRIMIALLPPRGGIRTTGNLCLPNCVTPGIRNARGPTGLSRTLSPPPPRSARLYEATGSQ